MAGSARWRGSSSTAWADTPYRSPAQAAFGRLFFVRSEGCSRYGRRLIVVGLTPSVKGAWTHVAFLRLKSHCEPWLLVLYSYKVRSMYH